ncbi:MAG: hypothetical protein IPF92_30610 [Myxococcales bacterium]|nr:hypothetical protein [Myxococcales bacterium]
MSDAFRDDDGALRERVAALEEKNAALRAEIERIRASIRPPASSLRRLRAPALVAALVLALLVVNTVRLSVLFRRNLVGQPSAPQL